MVSLRQRLASALLLAVSSVGLMALSGCAVNNGYTALPELEPVGLRQLWNRTIPLLNDEQITHAWRVGDSIFVSTSHRRLIRLTMAGTIAFDVDLEHQTRDIFRPIDLGDNEHLLVVTQGWAFVLDKAAGEIERSRPLNMIVTTDPHVIGDTLCVGGLNFFYGLYLDQLGGHKWVTAAPDDSFVASPATVSNDLFLASRSGRLWRVDGATGDWVWKDRKTNGPVVAGLATDGSNLFIPCLDNRVYAFNAGNGGELWEARLAGRLDRAAIPVRTQVLVPTTGSGLYSLATEDGSQQWLAPGVNQVGTIIGDRIWGEDESGNLKAIGLEKGDIISSTHIPNAQLCVYNTQDNLVLLINKSGTVGAYQPIGTGGAQ